MKTLGAKLSTVKGTGTYKTYLEIKGFEEKTAKVIGEKLIDDAKKQVLHIEQNAKKVIEAKAKLFISFF
jgi:hypothetical protein